MYLILLDTHTGVHFYAMKDLKKLELEIRVRNQRKFLLRKIETKARRWKNYIYSLVLSGDQSICEYIVNLRSLEFRLNFER